MQQHGHGLQGTLLIPAENVIEVKDQETLFIPLVPVNQCDLVLADEDNPAGTLIQVVQQTPQQFFHRLTEKLFLLEGHLQSGTHVDSHRRITQNIGGVGFIIIGDNQICAFHRCSENCPEQRRTVFLADFQRDWHLADIRNLFQLRFGCGRIVSKSCQQIPGDFRNSLGIGGFSAPTLLPATGQKIPLARIAQQSPGRPLISALCCLAPCADGIRRVLLKDGGKVVVGIVFVPVPDAGQIHAHAFTPMKTAAMRM